MDKEPEFTFKILLLGDAAVGKTSLIRRFVEGKFEKDYIMTIGMEPYSRYDTIKGTYICYSLWDIAGQDRFKAMRSMFFRGAKASIITFDLTRKSSFENTSKWIEEAREFSPDQLFILVGNKVDLEDVREVTSKEGQEMAKKLGAISYIETSAKTGINVGEAFTRIGTETLDKVQS